MTIPFFIATFFSIFSLINPLSALPVFISLTQNHETKWVNLQIKKTCLYILIICLISFFIGTFFLVFFGISISALKIAGGLMISRNGFLLLNAKHKKDIKGKLMQESLEKEDISFSPLAMPLLAGPGTISLLINLSIKNYEIKMVGIIIIAIICVVMCIYLFFSLAPKVLSYTGMAGLKSISKIMGFIVLSIGIEMMSAGVLKMLKIE